MHGVRLTRLLAAGCVVGLFGCSDASPDPLAPGRPGDAPAMPTSSTLAALAQASNCDDLLRKIQDDAVAKVKLAAERARNIGPEGESFGGVIGVDLDDSATSSSGSSNGGKAESAGVPRASSPVPASDAAGAGADPVAPSVPTGASDTNRQVKDVDEADFVKVVQNGAHMYVLHGNTLRRLKTFPAAQTALEGQAATLEGNPSEMFVSDAGKAVVFSTSYDGSVG
ncbi:MAG: beta-propeller domain-containing protein, partial [Polyangiales bacterium]